MSKIAFYFEDIQPLRLKKIVLISHIKYLINSELMIVGDLSIIFCSDDYLLNINKQYLDHDYYTDIITFNYVENKTISGDLFISVERITENAANYDTDMEKELFRVIFHGILHLIGYNDKTEEEKKLMKEKEDFYLNTVNFEEIML